jgi:hypothetical protein
MKKKIGACILMASMALGNKSEKGKSTLEIEWKNSKGEKKSFTINDIEKAFNADEIKGKTFLQEGIQTIGKLEKTETNAKSCERRHSRKCYGGRSRSASNECGKEGRYQYPRSHSRSHSRSRSRSSRHHSKDGDCLNRGRYSGNDYKDCNEDFQKRYKSASEGHYGRDRGFEGFGREGREEGYGLQNLKAYQRGGYNRGEDLNRYEGENILECKSGKCGKRGKYGKYGKGYNKNEFFERSSSRRKSRSGSGRKVFTMQHKPRYNIKGWDVGCEYPQERIITPANRYRRNANDQGYLNRHRDTRRNAANLDQLNRYLRAEKARKNQINAAAAISKRNENAKQIKKYADRNNKINKANQNIENCNAALADSGKNANKFDANLINKKNRMRHHSTEAKHSNNLMKIKDRCKEGLCMNELDNDNLRSDEKVIEEFDKLEHYKKINECNKSAEKNNRCNVKKRNDIDKNAKQCKRQGERGNRGKGNFVYANANKRNAFDYNDYSTKQKNEKKFNDNAECLKDDKYTNACTDNASNQNSCEDSNSCKNYKCDYDNVLGKEEANKIRKRDYCNDDNLCALRDQNICNDDLSGSPCEY